jgi:hypothetical protein
MFCLRHRISRDQFLIILGVSETTIHIFYVGPMPLVRLASSLTRSVPQLFACFYTKCSVSESICLKRIYSVKKSMKT